MLRKGLATLRLRWIGSGLTRLTKASAKGGLRWRRSQRRGYNAFIFILVSPYDALLSTNMLFIERADRVVQIDFFIYVVCLVVTAGYDAMLAFVWSRVQVPLLSEHFHVCCILLTWSLYECCCCCILFFFWCLFSTLLLLHDVLLLLALTIFLWLLFSCV